MTPSVKSEVRSPGIQPAVDEASAELQNYSPQCSGEFSKVYLGIYSSFILKAYFPTHIKVYNKSLMNKTGIFIFCKSLPYATLRVAKNVTLQSSFQGCHDLVSIISIMLLMWRCAPHLNIFFSLLLKNYFLMPISKYFFPGVPFL